MLDGPDHRDSVLDTESRKSGECHDDLHLLLLRLWSPWASGVIDRSPTTQRSLRIGRYAGEIAGIAGRWCAAAGERRRPVDA